ncbi:MAG: hypothetical protein ABIF71_15200 [Planctomycetota bacterium]
MRNHLVLLLVVVGMCGMLYAQAPPAPAPLVSIDIASLTGLAAAVWTPGTIDGRTAAVLKAGANGTVPLTAWWGAGLRPAEGAAFLAQVGFKDTADAPIVVKVFAGLPGTYEVHRIGGFKDGAWKTALVPLPWDMVMRVPGTDRTELVFTAPPGADVPMEKIVIVTGDPVADEARWSAETRDWTARVQAAKRAKAVVPEPQKSVPAGDAAVTAFVRPYHTLINTSSAPQAGETGVPVRIRCAQNEAEPAQFGVYANGRDLANVQVTLAVSPVADGRALAAVVDLRTAEYAVTSKGNLFPQRLWPAYAVAIPAGRSHLFWVTVTTTAGTSVPGTYRGMIKITADGLPAAELALEIEVLPIRLLTMTEAGLTMGGCTSGLLPAHELKTLVAYNHNGIDLWYSGFAPGIVRKSAKAFDLDFTIADDFMKHVAAAGIRNFVYFLGGNPYGFPDTCTLERELYCRALKDASDMMGFRLEFLKRTCEAPDKVLADIRPLFVQWAKKLMAHAAEAGWPEPILTPFDEPAKWVQEQNKARVYYYKKPDGRDSVDKIKFPEDEKFKKDLADKGITPQLLGIGGAGKWIKGHFKDACAAIHEGWPKARIYGSIHHNQPGTGWDKNQGICFLEDLEVFCTNAIHEDNKLGDKVRAGGPTKEFWQYSGGGDSATPSEGRYTFGFFFGSFNSRGSLAWAYNWGERFDTSSGDNWLYAWTTPYGVVPAPYFVGVREAWDDRRYIETLRSAAKAAGKAAEAEELLGRLFDRASKTRTEGGRDTVSDFWARTNDPAALDTMRNEVIAMLLTLPGPAKPPAPAVH